MERTPRWRALWLAAVAIEEQKLLDAKGAAEKMDQALPRRMQEAIVALIGAPQVLLP